MARTKDDDSRHMTNKGTTTARMRTRTRTTKGGAPHPTTASDCSQGGKRVLMDDQKDGGQASGDEQRGGLLPSHRGLYFIFIFYAFLFIYCTVK